MTHANLNTITNYLEISPTLGTGGQPTPEQFAALHASGYKVVINLAMPDSTNALSNEESLVKAQGMMYAHIPVVWEAPTLQDLEHFFATMKAHRDKKVFVHCAMNMRVSVFVFLYRILKLGIPVEYAQTALHRIWQPNPTWQHLINTARKENKK